VNTETFVPGSECSGSESSLPGTFAQVPFLELSLLGAKLQRNKKSTIQNEHGYGL